MFRRRGTRANRIIVGAMVFRSNADDLRPLFNTRAPASACSIEPGYDHATNNQFPDPVSEHWEWQNPGCLPRDARGAVLPCLQCGPKENSVLHRPKWSAKIAQSSQHAESRSLLS